MEDEREVVEVAVEEWLEEVERDEVKSSNNDGDGNSGVVVVVVVVVVVD